MTETRQVRFKRRNEVEEPSRWRQIATFLLVVAILLVGFCFAVRYVVDARQDLNSDSRLQSEGLFLQLSMKKTSYLPGEPIDVALVVKNVTAKSIKLEFDNDIEFDIIVQDDMDLLFTQVPQTVWRYTSDSDHFPKAKPHSLTILPGQEIGFKATWNQRNFKLEMVKPGRYTITAFLLAKDRTERLQLRGETK